MHDVGTKEQSNPDVDAGLSCLCKFSNLSCLTKCEEVSDVTGGSARVHSREDDGDDAGNVDTKAT